MGSRQSRMRIVAVFTVSLTAGVLTALAQDAAPKPAAAPQKQAVNPGLSEFMRQKLAASNEILEGLALDDLDLVQSGAQKLHQMSAAEKWRVYNDLTYRQYSSEFQRNTLAIAKAAREKNLDQAALKWFAATMSCIECHRFVRNELIAVEK